MEIFTNGKQHFYSFMEFYTIHSKKQGVKIGSQYHLNDIIVMLGPTGGEASLERDCLKEVPFSGWRCIKE